MLYAATVRPFDADTLVNTLCTADVAIVEPYAVGTSAAVASSALAHVPHRLESVGVRGWSCGATGPRTTTRRSTASTRPGLRCTLTDFFTS